MSGRSRTKLADGRWVTGFRKTMRRQARSDDPPDWRITVLIPKRWALRAPGQGATGFLGVTVEADQISGPLAVASGQRIAWLYQQLGRFLLAAAAGEERIITAQILREGCTTRVQQIAVQSDCVEFPRGGLGTLRITA